MPRYVAFLRAVNLGAKRRFGGPDQVAATVAAGGRDVQTYLATGNVRLTSPRRSTDAVARDLEAAYLADRGFEVPTVVFTPEQLRAVVADADDLIAQHGEPARVLVTLYAREPETEAVTAAHALDLPDSVYVRGRAAHAFLSGDVHTSTLLRHKTFGGLGAGTARTLTVLRTIAQRWCEPS